MGLFSQIKSAITSKPGEKPAAPAPTANAGATSPERATPPGHGRRILFVDGDAAAGLEFGRQLEQRRGWEVVSALKAREAYDRLAGQAFDAVVASAKMDDSSGVEFLNEVARRFPGLARLIRYAPEDKTLLRGFQGFAPLHLTRQMDAAEVEAGLECAFCIGNWMANDALRTLLPKMRRLPTIPDVYSKVMNRLASPSAAAEDVGKLIASEPALTAKMLQMVNSATFALAHHITSAVEAVIFLGAERTKALILMANASLHFDLSSCEGFSQEQLWRHSLATAGLARAITMQETRDAKLADEAFTAGLLHDVGKLLFAANLTAEYSRTLSVARNQRITEWEAERLALGTTHAELGACLLGTWGLPLRLLRAIAWHHAPSESDDGKFSLLTAVHAANAIDHGKSDGPNDAPLLKLDRHYLARLGLTEHWTRWRELLNEQAKAAA